MRINDCDSQLQSRHVLFSRMPEARLGGQAQDRMQAEQARAHRTRRRCRTCRSHRSCALTRRNARLFRIAMTSRTDVWASCGSTLPGRSECRAAESFATRCAALQFLFVSDTLHETCINVYSSNSRYQDLEIWLQRHRRAKRASHIQRAAAGWIGGQDHWMSMSLYLRQDLSTVQPTTASWKGARVRQTVTSTSALLDLETDLLSSMLFDPCALLCPVSLPSLALLGSSPFTRRLQHYSTGNTHTHPLAMYYQPDLHENELDDFRHSMQTLYKDQGEC